MIPEITECPTTTASEHAEDEDAFAPLPRPEQPSHHHHHPHGQGWNRRRRRRLLFPEDATAIVDYPHQNPIDNTTTPTSTPMNHSSRLCHPIRECTNDDDDDGDGEEAPFDEAHCGDRFLQTNNSSNRNTTTNDTTKKVSWLGPLSAVPLQTAATPHPHSIVRSSSRCSRMGSGTASIHPQQLQNPTPTPLTESQKQLDSEINNDNTATTLAIPNDMHAHDFAKLKLQVQVAQRRADRHRVAAKLTDRVQDVTQHRALWQHYQQLEQSIQEQQQEQEQSLDTTSNNTNVSGSTEQKNSGSTPISPKAAPQTTTPNSTTGSPRGYLRRRKNTRGAASATTVGGKTNNNSTDDVDNRAWSTATNSPSKESKLRNRRRRHTKQHQQEAENEDPQSLDRSDSFQLLKNKNQSGSWYFDFDDEFCMTQQQQASSNAAGKSTTNAPGNSGSSNHSQADLSLLSEASMKVQRRLYKEKERQRQMKKAAAKAQGQQANQMACGVPDGGGVLQINATTPVTQNGRGQHKGILDGTEQSGAFNPPSFGFAQQLLAVSGDDQVRMATEILQARNRSGMRNLEVEFRSPDANNSSRINASQYPDHENGSTVSDLDDTVSFSSMVSNSYGNNNHAASNSSMNDYGVKRRRRRSDQRGHDYGADHSSFVSDDDSSLGQQEHQTIDPEKVVFDFKSILQRRLDIEERLRALISMDDDENVDDTNETSLVTTTVNVLPTQQQVAIESGYSSQDGRVAPAVVSPCEGAEMLRVQRGNDPMDANYFMNHAIDNSFPGSPPSQFVPQSAATTTTTTINLNSREVTRIPVTPQQMEEKSHSTSLSVSDVRKPLSFEVEPSSSSLIAKTARGMKSEGAASSRTVRQTISDTSTETQQIKPHISSNIVPSPGDGQSENNSFESAESDSSIHISMPYLDSNKSFSFRHQSDHVQGDESIEASLNSNSAKNTLHVNGISRFSLLPSSFKSDADDDSVLANHSLNSLYDNEGMEDGRALNSLSGNAVAPRRTGILDDALDTLHLADQVEAQVKGILSRYRDENHDKEPILVSPAANT